MCDNQFQDRVKEWEGGEGKEERVGLMLSSLIYRMLDPPFHEFLLIELPALSLSEAIYHGDVQPYPYME